MKANIIVEGCADASLAEILVEKTGIHPATPPIITWGWRRAIRHSIILSAQTSLPQIVFIDADKPMETRIREIKNNIEETIAKENLGTPIYEEYREHHPDNKENNIPAIKTTLENNKTIIILFWLDPLNQNCMNLECLLRRLLIEAYQCNIPQIQTPPCTTLCPAKNSKVRKTYGKLSIITTIASCAGIGTLAKTESQKHCGIPLKETLEKLAEINQTKTFNLYTNLLKQAT